MIAKQVSTGLVSSELAATIRKVNAAHAASGGRENENLKTAWLDLDRALSLAVISGNDAAARTAVDTYERRALAAIEEVR